MPEADGKQRYRHQDFKPLMYAKGTHSSLSGLYQALMNHYLHQDRLLWSSVQTIIAIQGAVLGAGYYVYRLECNECGWLAAIIMFLGAALTAIILHLVTLYISDRDVNLIVMDELVKRLLSDSIGGIKKKIKKERDENIEKEKESMDRPAKIFLPSCIKNKIKKRLQKEKEKNLLVRLTSVSPSYRHVIGGGRIFKCVLVTLLILDILLALDYLGCNIFPFI